MFFRLKTLVAQTSVRTGDSELNNVEPLLQLSLPSAACKLLREGAGSIY